MAWFYTMLQTQIEVFARTRDISSCHAIPCTCIISAGEISFTRIWGLTDSIWHNYWTKDLYHSVYLLRPTEYTDNTLSKNRPVHYLCLAAQSSVNDSPPLTEVEEGLKSFANGTWGCDINRDRQSNDIDITSPAISHLPITLSETLKLCFPADVIRIRPRSLAV